MPFPKWVWEMVTTHAKSENEGKYICCELQLLSLCLGGRPGSFQPGIPHTFGSAMQLYRQGLHALWPLADSVHSSCWNTVKELKGQNLLLTWESLGVRCCSPDSKGHHPPKWDQISTDLFQMVLFSINYTSPCPLYSSLPPGLFWVLPILVSISTSHGAQGWH